MKKFSTLSTIIIASILIAIVFILFSRISNTSPILGSIQDGMAYNSTTTDSTWSSSAVRMIKTSNGTLGSVIITGATAGAIFELRDATSTIDAASTSIAKFTATAVSGTYTFDVSFNRGLAANMTSGTIASTTITWR